MPRVRRKTDKRLPRYDGSRRVRALRRRRSGPGAAVRPAAGAQRYRPAHRGACSPASSTTPPGTDHWEVWSQRRAAQHATAPPGPPPPTPAWRDPAVIADPDHPDRVLAWLLTETVDTFGNRIAYSYEPDPADPAGAQRYLTQIGYADYGDPANPAFLVQVRFDLRSRGRTGTPTAAAASPSPPASAAPRIETWMQPGPAGAGPHGVTLTYADATRPAADNGASLLAAITHHGPRRRRHPVPAAAGVRLHQLGPGRAPLPADRRHLPAGAARTGRWPPGTWTWSTCSATGCPTCCS